MTDLPDKNKDPFSRLIHASQLEKPSPNFTGDVLNKLGLQQKEVISYQPVIKPGVWFLIALVIFAILFLAVTGNNAGNIFRQTDALQSVIQQSASGITSIFTGQWILLLTLVSCAGLALTWLDSWFRKNKLRQA